MSRRRPPEEDKKGKNVAGLVSQLVKISSHTFYLNEPH